MTGSDIILLPSSSTLETENLDVAKDVVSSSSNLEVAKKDALETEKKPMDSEGGPKSAGTETEAKGERSQSKEKEVKDEGKDVHAKGSGTEDEEQDAAKVDAVKMLQSLTPVESRERDPPPGMDRLGMDPTDPLDMMWEAQASWMRSRAKVSKAMDETFGDSARTRYQKYWEEVMGPKCKIAAEVADKQCDAAMVAMGKYLRIGMDRCSDQLDSTLAYMLNEPVINKEVVPDGPTPTFTDLTDTDATRTTHDTDTDTGWESPARGRNSRSRSDNQYLTPMNSKKTKRRMFKNLMTAAEKSPGGRRGGKGGRRNKKGQQPLLRSQSTDESGFYPADRPRQGSLFDPSASQSTVRQGNIGGVIDVTGAEVDRMPAYENMKQQSYRKYGVRDEDGITHIDLLEEHVDLVDNHIDLVDLVDESREDLIDLTDLADGTPTW